MLPALYLRRWKPILVLDQAAQIFDLTGVAGVAGLMMSSGAAASLFSPGQKEFFLHSETPDRKTTMRDPDDRAHAFRLRVQCSMGK